MLATRKLLASASALSFFAALCLTSQLPPPASRAGDGDSQTPFSLELPEVGPQQYTAPEVFIPHTDLSTLKLHLRRPLADAVSYGNIYTKINGESAATAFEKRAAADGYVLIADLRSKPRFRLQPGKNVIEILARSKDGREHYASYVLLTGDRRPGDAGLDSDAVIETLPVAAGGDRQPPHVYLTQPTGVVQLAKDSGVVRVVGLVADGAGVTAVGVNGRAAKLMPAVGARGLSVSAPLKEADGAGVLSNVLEFSETVSITPSTASLVIEARDAAGNLTRVTIPVRRRSALVSAEFRGRKYALVVGVSKYRYAEGGFRNLAYADADARAVRDFLQRREGGGFAPSDITYLENEGATLAAVRGALKGFLSRAAGNDLVFVFIAGHGGPDEYAPQNLYFLLHDTKLADMPNTALPMAELKEALEHGLLARRVVAFVDTCHSAGLTGEKAAARAASNNLINLYAAKLFSDTGRAVITSSDVNEVSRESAEYGGGHGVFTWALLEGLGGGADLNDDRLVTAGELFGYVRNRVRVATGFRQNPRALPGLNADVALAFVRGG
jgi:hypothetical protein